MISPDKNPQNNSIQMQRELILNNLHLFRSSNDNRFYVIETSALEAYCESYIGLDIDNFRIKTLEVQKDNNSNEITPKPFDRVEGLLGRLQE